MRAGRLAFVALALATVMAGCGGETDDHAQDERIERFEVRGQAAVVLQPGRPTRKVVVYTHGAGERVDNAFREPRKDPIFRALLDGGYAIAMTDAHGDNWGSPASLRDQLALAAALRERGLRDVYVLALSMGGLDGLQLLGRVEVKAWAGIFPACDLGSVWDRGLYRRQIRAAYGLGARESPSAVLRPRSPVSIDPPAGLPMRFWASPDDRVIPMRPNTTACAQLARRRGAQVEVTTTRGDHGDASNYDAAGVLRLFDSVPG